MLDSLTDPVQLPPQYPSRVLYLFLFPLLYSSLYISALRALLFLKVLVTL